MIGAALPGLVSLWLASTAPAHPLRAEIDRLVGHTVEVSDSSYRIVDVAGEGEARIGCIFREQGKLYFEEGTGTARIPLTGPLALPRIAGPNYKVWIIGEVRADDRLFVRRIGILAPPSSSRCVPTKAATGNRSLWARLGAAGQLHADLFDLDVDSQSDLAQE